MPLTAGEIIKVKQILKVSADRRVELADILAALSDLDAIANVRGIFTKWDALKLSDSPDRAGMSVAKTIQWDVMERCSRLSRLEAEYQRELAIAINYQLDPPEVLAF